MMLDIPQERGMSHADVYYPNEDRECQFPLFNFLEPFRAEYMVVVYVIMFLGIYIRLFCFVYLSKQIPIFSKALLVLHWVYFIVWLQYVLQ